MCRNQPVLQAHYLKDYAARTRSHPPNWVYICNPLPAFRHSEARKVWIALAQRADAIVQEALTNGRLRSLDRGAAAENRLAGTSRSVSMPLRSVSEAVAMGRNAGLIRLILAKAGTRH